MAEPEYKEEVAVTTSDETKVAVSTSDETNVAVSTSDETNVTVFEPSSWSFPPSVTDFAPIDPQTLVVSHVNEALTESEQKLEKPKRLKGKRVGWSVLKKSSKLVNPPSPQPSTAQTARVETTATASSTALNPDAIYPIPTNCGQIHNTSVNLLTGDVNLTIFARDALRVKSQL